jgi:phage FluMu gp28-like protein
VIGAACVRRCCIDATGLGMSWAEDRQRKHGTYRVEPCPFTPAFLSQIAGETRARFDSKTVLVPDSKVIRDDLHSVQKSVTAAGNVRLSAPREAGSHADRFYALALAIHAAGTDAGPIEAIWGPELSMPKGEMW